MPGRGSSSIINHSGFLAATGFSRWVNGRRTESSRIARIDAEFAEENLMDQSLCSECGGPLAEGQTCRSLFDALLALEWQIPGGPGELADFRA